MCWRFFKNALNFSGGVILILRQTSRILVIVAVTFGCAPYAQAAGFYLQEQSTTHQGMSFAGAAADPVDASTIYFNPAGMTSLKNADSQVGVNMIAPYLRMTDRGTSVTTGGTSESITATSGDGGNPYHPSPVPNAYLAIPVDESHRAWVGLGVTFPFGLASEYEDDFYGRYDSTKSVLKVVDMAPSFGYAAYDWLSIGGGLNIQHADGQLANAYPNPAAAAGTPDPSTDGYQDLSGQDVSFGYNIGLMARPRNDTRIGLHYRSAINHDLRGRVITKLPAALGATTLRFDGTAKLKLPDIATLAAAYDVNDRLTVQGHVIWFGWSNFNDLPVDVVGATDSAIVQNYRDTIDLALGAKYRMNDDWQIKAGYQFDQTPTQDNYRNTRMPDGDRHWFSAGATYHLNDRIDLDVAGTYIKVMPGDIDLTRSFATGSVQIHGTTEADIGILSAGLRYKF